jgi:hypothetical protein
MMSVIIFRLRFYVFAMMTIFVGQLVYSLMIYGVGFRMVPLIIQDGQDPNQLLTYLTNTAIYSGAICGIHVI